MTDSSDDNALAFEYALGTLRGPEREVFEARLRHDDQLAQEVRYWESTLMPDPESVPKLEPKAGGFAAIQAQINQQSTNLETPIKSGFWQRLLPWQAATSMAFALLVVVSVLLVNQPGQPNPLAAPNTDYVAVLVSDNDEPILTALTASDGSKLWLKWENWQAPENHSLQLWAQSRRDGEVRPLLVFEGEELQEVVLDQATWRLIKDSSHLIITREEVGGSPLDEPSEQVIAKGVCIRLVSGNSNV